MDPVLLVAIFAVALFAVFFAVAWLAATRRYAETARQRDEFRTRVDVLSKYEGVHDAAAEEQRLREEARRLTQDAQTEASQIEARAREKAKEAKSAASAAEKEAKEQRDRLLILAQQEAKATRLKATAEAEQIAGSAWEAKANAEKYVLTAKAMRNIIEGYGDEYLIPNISLLDKLADDFSHKDAGVQLKSARLIDSLNFFVVQVLRCLAVCYRVKQAAQWKMASLIDIAFRNGSELTVLYIVY